MALPIASALRSAGKYALRNPSTLFSIAKHAVSLRIAIPIDTVRWFIDSQAPGKNRPTDVTVIATPPGITVGASLDLMGTPVRSAATAYVDELLMSENQLEVTIRLANVSVDLLKEVNTPVAGLLKSGALDLSKPGNLANFIPKKPPVLVHAKDDKVTLDLLQEKKIANNPKVQRVLSTVAPVVTVKSVHTEGDLIVLNLKAKPSGLRKAFNAARQLPA